MSIFKNEMKSTKYVLMRHGNPLLIYIDGERIPVSRYSIAEVINECISSAYDLSDLLCRPSISIAVYVKYLVRIDIHKSIQYLVC